MPPGSGPRDIRFKRTPDGTIVLTQGDDAVAVPPELLHQVARILDEYESDSVDFTPYIAHQEAMDRRDISSAPKEGIDVDREPGKKRRQ